jgi:hypothetical protein
MNRETQAPDNTVAWVNPGDAFRAQLKRSIPDIPVVSSTVFHGLVERRAARAAHWLSRFVTHPEAVATSGISVLKDRSSRNIAEWSGYLPADCVAAMVARGWDRTC